MSFLYLFSGAQIERQIIVFFLTGNIGNVLLCASVQIERRFLKVVLLQEVNAICRIVVELICREYERNRCGNCLSLGDLYDFRTECTLMLDEIFIKNEARYTRLMREFPDRAEALFAKSEKVALDRYAHLLKLKDLYAPDAE